MKNKLLFQVLLVFLPLLSFGQQRWETIISDENYALVTNTISYDGGELISAVTGGNGSNKSIIIKFNKNGEELWRKKLIFEDWNSPWGIKQNQHGEIIMFGTTANKASAILLDPCMNLVWCNEFNNSENYPKTNYTSAVFLQNGDIVLLMAIDYNNGVNDLGLISFDIDGNFLWFHPFNLLEKYPLLIDIYEWHLEQFDNFLLLSGYGYYAYPENPNLSYLKPMFVKTDSSFNEEWLLPYGLADIGSEDTILGDARGVVSYQNGVFHGWGSSTKPLQAYYTSILMNFDSTGQETNYHIIENNMIDSTATENFFLDLAIRDDTSYFTSIKYGNLGWENPSGEVIMDTMGIVYQHQSHTNANLQGGIFPLERETISNQYYLAYMNYDWDIVLYKFNDDLSDTPLDTNSYNYDSLCNNLPIVSDTIYVSNCGIITGVEELPTQQEYFSFIKTIPVKIFPNPATSGVTFELGNTEKHKDIRLSCFDINGKLIFEQALPPGQTQIQTTVSDWQSGMYIAVAGSSTGGAGSAKFVVSR